MGKAGIRATHMAAWQDRLETISRQDNRHDDGDSDCDSRERRIAYRCTEQGGNRKLAEKKYDDEAMDKYKHRQSEK